LIVAKNAFKTSTSQDPSQIPITKIKQDLGQRKQNTYATVVLLA
jgi:hypothetical protein